MLCIARHFANSPVRLSAAGTLQVSAEGCPSSHSSKSLGTAWSSWGHSPRPVLSRVYGLYFVSTPCSVQEQAFCSLQTVTNTSHLPFTHSCSLYSVSVSLSVSLPLPLSFSDSVFLFLSLCSHPTFLFPLWLSFTNESPLAVILNKAMYSIHIKIQIGIPCYSHFWDTSELSYFVTLH